MLLVTVADSENQLVGLYRSDDRAAVIEQAIANLKAEHDWTPELEFHEKEGPPWLPASAGPRACGFLARPDDYREDPEYIVQHEGTAWVYVREPEFDVMIEY